MSDGGKKVIFLSQATPAALWSDARTSVLEGGASAYMLQYDLLRAPVPADLAAAVHLLDEVLPEEDVRSVNRRATSWAMEWHHAESLKPFLRYGSLNVGDLVYFALFNYQNTLLRLHALVARTLERESPDEVHLYIALDAVPTPQPRDEDALLELIAATAAAERGIVVHIHRAAPPPGRRIPGPLRRVLRQGRRQLLVLRSHIADRKLSKQAPPQDGIAAAFVRSSHSIVETAGAFDASGCGTPYYVGLGDEGNFRDRRAASAGVRFVDLYRYMPVLTPATHRVFLSRLLNRLETGVDSLASPEHVQNASYLETIFRRALVAHFAAEGPWVLRYLDAAREVLRLTGARAIFADNSQQPIERTFLRLGAAAGCQTVESAHSLCNDIFELGFPEHFITDSFFAWGAHDRRLMERLGAPPGMVAEVGVGRFAHYFDAPPAGRADCVVRLGLTCDKEHKFYGVTGLGCLRDVDHLRRYRAVIDLARKDPTLVLSLKLRAGIEGDYYLVRMLREAGITNYEIVQSGDVAAWLRTLNILLTDFSTLGLEAMIFDVPVLIHRSELVGDALGFEGSGAVDVVEPDLGNLRDLVYHTSSQPGARRSAREQFVKSAIGPRDRAYHERRAAFEIAALPRSGGGLAVGLHARPA